MSWLLVVLALGAPTKSYEARAVECYDGDTCIFEVWLGLGVTKTEDVRICNVKTLPQAKKLSTKDWVFMWLKAADRVTLIVPQRCRGNRCEYRNLHRLLSWVVADGQDVGRLLVDRGYGRVDMRCGDQS